MVKKQEQIAITLSPKERELLKALAKQRATKEASLAAQFVKERLNHVFDLRFAVKK
jgi:predicted DNA-binding protein